jgi:prevent-host-death family protein
MDIWTVASAKAKLSEVIDRALSDGPQTITRNRRKAVVVVAADEWERMSKRTGNLAEFLEQSPLRRARVRIERAKGGLRNIDL